MHKELESLFRGHQLNSKRRLIIIIVAMAIAGIMANIVPILLLYRVAIDQQSVFLYELVEARKGFIEHSISHDGRALPEQRLQDSLAALHETYNDKPTRAATTELIIGYSSEGRTKLFLDNGKHPAPSPLSVDPSGTKMEAMERALNGLSGTVIGPDYKNTPTLSAYAPVSFPGYNVGIVAKIDMAEVRSPYWSAASTSLFIAALLCLVISYFVWRVGRPILSKIAADEEFRSAVFKHAPDGMIVIDQLGEIVLINERLKDMFGYSESELVGQMIEMLVPCSGRDKHVHYRNAAFATNGARAMSVGLDLNGLTKSGLEIPVEISLNPIQIRLGMFMLAAVRDVSDRRQIELQLSASKQELEDRVIQLEDIRNRFEIQASEAVTLAEGLSEAEQRLRAAIDNISEGFALWDESDRLIMCNPRYKAIYPELIDMLEPGLTFESFVRAAFERGIFDNGSQDLEEAIIDRVIRHRTSVTGFEHQLENGTWVRVSKRATESGHIVGIVSDISQRKDHELLINKMAWQDSLTLLPNRAKFQDKLDSALVHSARTGRSVGLLLLDVDRFKAVNDSLGHPIGDELLKQISQRLLSCCRESDTVARLGGDEFAIIVANIFDTEGATRLADRIIRKISECFTVERHQIHTNVSIGITIYPEDTDNSDQLLRNADLALYRAKEAGRGLWKLFDETMSEEITAGRQLEEDMRTALSENEFDIHYQPRVNISTGQLIGGEALIRWQHPTRGPLSPEIFIPVAESTGLIIDITEQMMQRVCSQIRCWQDAGLAPVPISVNLSPLCLKNENCLDSIMDILRNNDLDPALLELEITEGMVMSGGKTELAKLSEIRNAGVRLSIDDFGTGHSSLGRLRLFSVDCLKIDRSFVRDIVIDRSAAAICSAAISLGNGLNIEVIAEGVETLDQVKFLVKHGCEQAQGFLFSPAVPAEAFGVFLREGFVPVKQPSFAK